MSQFISTAVIQYFLLVLQLNGYFCNPVPLTARDASGDPVSNGHISTFDPRILHKVKTLFTRNLLQNEGLSRKIGTKKSLIETAYNTNSQPDLHLKIDPRAFGQTLLDKAQENAARKSDIYMDKAIDATALGTAVLKLIFGKDAKMVMKSNKASNAQASLRAKAFRPEITSWSTSAGERKSALRDPSWNGRKSDKITRLSGNILNLVKNLRPISSLTKKESDNIVSLRDKPIVHIARKPKQPRRFTSKENGLLHLLSLIKETSGNGEDQKGAKKSWVLLKVPNKQPQDEIGMLTDPTKTDENSNDNSEHHDILQEIRPEHNGNSEAKISQKQQSNEGEFFTNSITSASKSLKSEPVQEVNAVKTDTTPELSHEGSVINLLQALESTAHKDLPAQEPAQYIKEKLHHEKPKLVSTKNVEENAAAKDELAGGGSSGGALVSLDALRQLGQLLGLSGQHSDAKISPYTGTADTLTLATASPPNLFQNLIATTPTPTVPPTPAATTAPTMPTKYSEGREMSLNRISEQLKMFAERGLKSHNEYRKLHHAEPLKWSEDLASAAEKLAYQAAKRGSTKRSHLVENKGYGENVAKISNVMLENAGEEATRHWYNEKEHFTFSDPVVDDVTMAFTQLIWKNTKIIGMGAAKDDDTGELYVVALYHPKGNEGSTLRENIQSDGKNQADVYSSIFKKSTPVYHTKHNL